MGIDFNRCMALPCSRRPVLRETKKARNAVAILLRMRSPTSAERYCQYVSHTASMESPLTRPEAWVRVTVIMATVEQRENAQCNLLDPFNLYPPDRIDRNDQNFDRLALSYICCKVSHDSLSRSPRTSRVICKIEYHRVRCTRGHLRTAH